MHEHLGLQLAGSSIAPPTPPATQNSSQSGSGSSSLPSITGPNSSGLSGPSAPRSSVQSRTGISHVPAQQQPSQNTQQPALQHQDQQQVVQQQQVTHASTHPPPQVQGQPAVTPADEIAAIRARIMELEQSWPPHQALIADATAIDHVRTNLAIAKDEPKKLALPALRPGHKVSTLSLHKSTVPIPPKVEEVFKLYRYVPYTAITHAAQSKSYLRGEDSTFVFTPEGLTAKGLDRSNELLISAVDWFAAAKAAEERTLHYWGIDRESALVSHHLDVLDISRTHGWPVAMHYDVQQRELAHVNHDHNLAGLDIAALTLASNKITCTVSSAPQFNSPTKRSAPSNFATSPHKKSQVFASNHCFHCGASGHLPADCTANSTTAGKPIVPLATGARSKHALATLISKHFCFNWASASNCAFGTACKNAHLCSLCGDSSHGAGSCKSRG
ncbi:hypothetical protein EDD22DRAFT_909485 [Suillus occidentalis]|nr:hypothetical protein EDD22DRAFT_909485 [Suillus occidentalis]